MTIATKKVIDADGRAVGRIASEAASVLMGKDNAIFARNIVPKVSVDVVNASKARIPATKLSMKEYFRHSGYPGGGTTETMDKVIKKFGHAEIVRRAVYGMLPKNKLRKIMMKGLSVTN